MGYYSKFDITVLKVGETVVPETGVGFLPMMQKLEDISGYSFDEEDNTFTGGDNYKWYDCTKDMKALSAEFPEALFKVHREGEDAGDIEETYFKGGKLVHTEILNRELPQPDISKF